MNRRVQKAKRFRRYMDALCLPTTEQRLAALNVFARDVANGRRGGRPIEVCRAAIYIAVCRELKKGVPLKRALSHANARNFNPTVTNAEGEPLGPIGFCKSGDPKTLYNRWREVVRKGKFKDPLQENLSR